MTAPVGDRRRRSREAGDRRSARAIPAGSSHTLVDAWPDPAASFRPIRDARGAVVDAELIDANGPARESLAQDGWPPPTPGMVVLPASAAEALFSGLMLTGMRSFWRRMSATWPALVASCTPSTWP